MIVSTPADEHITAGGSIDPIAAGISGNPIRARVTCQGVIPRSAGEVFKCGDRVETKSEVLVHNLIDSCAEVEDNAKSSRTSEVDGV